MKIAIQDIPALFFGSNGTYIKETSVFTDGSVIKAVGDMPRDFRADKVINGKNKLLLPGLINAHTHSYMSLFRNRADDLPFNKWLFDNILPLEDKLTGEDSYWGSMLAVMEMLRTGTTCFVDMYMFIEETVRAVDETGIRAYLSRGLVDSEGLEGGERRLNEARSEIKGWRAKNNSRINFFLAPHAPYTCSPEYLTRVGEAAAELGVGLNVHLAESKNEDETIKKQYGCTPAEYLEKAGILRNGTLAAHCVYVSGSDMDILKKHNVSVVTNPVSNLKLGNGVAPLGEMMDKGINICLGTDGAASNNTLNLFKDLHFVTLLHKGWRHDAELISAGDGLKFATVNAAKALSDSAIGEIAAGRKADLVILDIDKPQFYPRNNLVSALAYSTSGTEVETVIVDGQVLLEKGEYKTIDTEKVIFNVKRITDKFNKI